MRAIEIQYQSKGYTVLPINKIILLYEHKRENITA